MKIQIEKANKSDAAIIHEMQIKAFRLLLEKYKDYETNPGNETIERIISRFNEPTTAYFKIILGPQPIGAVRIAFCNDNQSARISPIFILPEFQGKGYAQEAFCLLENEYSTAKIWHLSTILQEPKLCHLYEKSGYIKTGYSKDIKEGMTIIHYDKTKQ